MKSTLIRLAIAMSLLAAGIQLIGAGQALARDCTLDGGCRDFVVADLRNDLSEIYQSLDYRIQLLTAGGGNAPLGWFTAAWLGLYLSQNDPPPFPLKFTQVGIKTNVTGAFWFVESEAGVTCLAGYQRSWRLCEGAVNQYISPTYWSYVELVSYPGQGYWIARVYEPNGTPHDVARIPYASSRVYTPQAAIEEAYNVAQDPHYNAYFDFQHPQYLLLGIGLREWATSVGSGADSYIFPTDLDGFNTFCPQQYAAVPYINGDSRAWYAGSHNGGQCQWLLFPSSVTYLPDARLNNGWSYWFAARNNGPNTATLTASYFNSSGSFLCADRYAPASGAQALFFANQSCGSTAAGVTLEADQDIRAVATREQTGPYVVDGYSGITAPATTVLAPLVHRNNSGWYSDLIIMNAGSSTTNVSVAFQQVNVSGDTCSQTFSNVPAYGTVVLSTASSCIPGSGQYVGSARVSSQSSQPLAVVVTQRKDYNGDGRTDSFSEYVGLPLESAALTNHYPLLMQGNSNWGAGVTLQNNDVVNNSSGNVSLFNGTGGACGSAPYTVPYRSVIAIFPLPLSCSTPYVGNGRASFNVPLAGIVNYIHAPASDYSYMSENAVGRPTSTAVIPLAIRNATFWSRGGWYTGLNIQNTGSSTAHGQVNYYGSGGNLITTQPIAVAPNSSLTIFPLPSALGDNFIGSAWVSSDQPIAVSVTHQPAFAAGEDAAFAYAADNR